jgi:hypothetical protein
MYLTRISNACTRENRLGNMDTESLTVGARQHNLTAMKATTMTLMAKRQTVFR